MRVGFEASSFEFTRRVLNVVFGVLYVRCVYGGVNVTRPIFLNGGWEGSLCGGDHFLSCLKESRELLFFWFDPWPTARSHVGVLGSLRVLATSRLRLPVPVPAVSPRELTGTAALQSGIPPGALGCLQILGMVLARLPGMTITFALYEMVERVFREV